MKPKTKKLHIVKFGHEDIGFTSLADATRFASCLEKAHKIEWVYIGDNPELQIADGEISYTYLSQKEYDVSIRTNQHVEVAAREPNLKGLPAPRPGLPAPLLGLPSPE
ncbi:MAG: hypothetical protein ACQKBY_05050 [Verrucomicrobiales bacterium]